jgi:UrcA family protein
MKTTLIKAGICAAVSGLLCTVAIAQKIPEIQVRAHRGVTTQQVGRDRAGIPVSEATMSLGVSLADLDLSTDAGNDEAKKRIFAAAGEVCMDIVREFPEEVHTLQKCTRDTSRQAESELRRLVAAAGNPGVAR